jgi:hypothetical protein
VVVECENEYKKAASPSQSNKAAPPNVKRRQLILGCSFLSWGATAERIRHVAVKLNNRCLLIRRHCLLYRLQMRMCSASCYVLYLLTTNISNSFRMNHLPGSGAAREAEVSSHPNKRGKSVPPASKLA